MRALFAEFGTIPDWVDPERLVERGHHRYGGAGPDSLGAVGNAGTMDTPRRRWPFRCRCRATTPVPAALHRYLEQAAGGWRSASLVLH